LTDISDRGLGSKAKRPISKREDINGRRSPPQTSDTDKSNQAESSSQNRENKATAAPDKSSTKPSSLHEPAGPAPDTKFAARIAPPVTPRGSAIADRLTPRGVTAPSSLPDADVDAEEDDDLRSGLLDVKMKAVEWAFKRQRQREDLYEQNPATNSVSHRFRSRETHVELQHKLSSIGSELRDLETPRHERSASSLTAWFQCGYYVDHEELWQNFVVKTSSLSTIQLDDIPFPSIAKMRAQMGKQESDEAREKIFRKVALRWHPDKFLQRYGTKLHEESRQLIMDRVKDTFQSFNSFANETNSSAVSRRCF